MALVRKTNAITTTTTTPTTSVGDSGISDKNKGGLIGGIGYLGEKLAVGTVQSIEGISDYAIGGIAKLFGFDKFAERQFRNDWFGDWYTHPDEWFNAGKGWKVAGDVFGGIGTSLPAILAATGVTIATAGAGAGAGAAILAKSGAVAGASFLTAGLGAAGNATKEAYQETGKLTGKEFGYGALTGTLEGGLEGVTNVIGMGSGAVVKSIAKNFGKEAFESAVRQGVGITLAKSFAGEAFEEGAAEAMSGKFKRMTYDKNADNATGSQIAYASIIGGFSGVLMGGAGSVFNAAQNTARGTQIVEKGQTEQVLALAKAINDKADAEKLGDIKQFKQVEATYKALAKSLEKTNGEVKTAYQRRLLGELKIDNFSAVFAPKMFNEASRIVGSADLIAEAYKGVDENGQPISYTKEQMLEGVDLDNLRATLPKALETNEALRQITMSSMVGEMLMDTSAFQQAILNGERFAGEADLENFRKEAPDEQKREVERVLGIDNIDTVDSATFNAKVEEFTNSPRYQEYYDLNEQMKARAGQPIEETLSNESATTQSSETATERQAMPESVTETTATPETKAMSVVDSIKYANENIKEYKSLDTERQARVRRLIRQMSMNGFTDAQMKAYARVSARSGIDIVIGKDALQYKNAKGETRYADGKYSPDENRIYVNPEGSRSPAKLLFHELTHALYTDAESKVWLDEAAKNLSDEDKKRVKALYFQDANLDETKLNEDDKAKYNDEISSRYIEGMLNDDVLLEKLCDKHPTLEEKIINFLTGAEKAYANEPTLSREAKKLYKRYKTLFDSFAEGNQYRDVKAEGEERLAFDEHRGNGYDGYSMSNNARTAYADGEMPLSKWRRTDIVEAVADINPSIDISKLNLDTLKSRFLRRSSWHHTSMMYNATDFYSINEEYIEELTQSDVDGIAEKQEPKPRTKRDASLDKRVESEYKKALTLVEAGIVTTENGAIKRLITGKGFEDRYQKAVELIRRRDANKVNHWRNLPADHYRQEHVRLYDTDIEKYIYELYADKSLSKNSKVFKDIANHIVSEDNTSRDRMAISDADITEENLFKVREQKDFLQHKVTEAKKKADSLKDSEKEKALLDLISPDTPKDTLDKAIEEYKKWQDESGYSAAYEELSELEKQLHEVRLDEEQIEHGLSKQLLTKEYTEEEIAKYAAKAARKFHTTSRLKLAGYLTTNGSMLDFSQGQGYRVSDHREISEILDLPEYAGYSDGMIVFMNMGNIRLQTYGIDIAAMPNTKQITALRSIIPEVMREYDEFTVDFSTKNGYTDGSVTYPRGTATTRIISDIKSYFETGVVPEEPSNLAQFRYAISDEDIDNFDVSRYNEVSIPSGEYSRIQSEALTWDAKNKNEIRKRTLSNGISYRYIIDDDNIVHVIGREKSKNIHDLGEKYDNRNTKRLDRSIEGLRIKQRGRRSRSSAVENGREQRKNDRSNNSEIRQQRDSDRAGYTEDRDIVDRGTEARIQESPIKVVHTFTNIAGQKKSVIKINSEYYIKDNHRAKPTKSIEEAVENENNRVIDRYAKIHNHTRGHVKRLLEEKPDLLIKSRKRGERLAISDDELANYKNIYGNEDSAEKSTSKTDEEVNELDMSESVGKQKKQYKLTFKEKFFSAIDNLYIETVDEMFGIAKYLKKVGKVGSKADAIIQAIRASRSSAQTMIGDVQIDSFSGTGKVQGEGLLKIIKPITVKGEKVSKSFNEYMLHWLNVDRMSLKDKSLAELAGLQSNLEEDVAKLREVNGKIADAKDKKKSIFSDEVAQADLDKKIEKLEKQRKALVKSVKDLKKQIDSFEVMENKPVFGENESRSEALTAEQSRKRIEELEKAHPDFKAVAEKLWKYTKNLNHMRVEAGLISADSEAYMNELYPHYVPAYRDFSYNGVSAIRGKGNLQISSTVKRAKGGGLDILEIADSIASQTQEVMRAGRINMLFNELYNVAVTKGGSEYVEIIGEENVSRQESASMQANSIELKPKSNQITGYVEGKKVTLAVSNEIFVGFDSVGKPSVDPNNKIAVIAQRANELYKRLLTSFSPAFFLRNPIRDLQDAGLNSKHAKLFAKNLPKSAKLMFENSKEWQLYRAYGGYSSSIFNSEGGFTSEIDKRGFAEFVKLLDADATTAKNVYNVLKNGGKNILTGIENANAFVEQMTRFTEFLASLEAGDSIDTAINNSAEVSTNFGRRGRTTKVFNATVMPFLNPSIQGFDKMIRNVSDAVSSDNVAKALGVLFAKAAAIGLAPIVINLLLYGGDDDYEELRETDKENNFLIKVGDGKFIKIPRGRVASVIGGAANRAVKLAKGEDADIKGYAKNVIDQVTPVQNFTRTIFSPFFDAKNNLTWYGTDIEGREFDNTAPKDRYDENTSSIAIAIGKVTKWSPKKIHYVLDQYSGVIGDFVLPATTSKAERDFFSGNFVIDASTSNKISAQFYEMYDKAQYARTAGDDTAIYQVKYLNKVKSAISEMYDEKSKVQNDKTLSSADKLQKTRTIQILINEAYKSAMADYELYTQAIGATQGIENTEAFKNMFGESATEESIQKMRYTEAIHLMYGAERALKEYNSDVYEKSQLLNLAGIDYESIYKDYFSTKGITSDTNKQGKAISGSKRKKIVATITAMKIPTEQKLLLIASKGYSLQDNDIRGLSGEAAKKRLLNYILKLNISKEERIRLAEMCGFEVKNGKIILKK